MKGNKGNQSVVFLLRSAIYGLLKVWLCCYINTTVKFSA